MGDSGDAWGVSQSEPRRERVGPKLSATECGVLALLRWLPSSLLSRWAGRLAVVLRLKVSEQVLAHLSLALPGL